MRRNQISVVLLALCAIPAMARTQQETVRNFDRTVPLGAGQRLQIESKFGEIKVHGAAQKDMVIHATIRAAAASQSEAQSLAEGIKIDVQQSASGVSIRTIYPERERSWFGSHDLSYSVNYDITLPESAPLEVRNEFGEVTLSHCKGGSRVVNGHGALHLLDGAGTHNLQDAFGAVEVSGNHGDVTINNGNGAVTVSDVSGSVDVKNRFGKVTARNTGRGVTIVNNNGAVTVDTAASANVTNSFGEVGVHAVHGDVNVQNGNGAITATNAGGAAWLKTSFGSIAATDVGKTLNATDTNGSIRAARVGGQLTAKASFGSIDLSQVNGGIDVMGQNGAVKAVDVKGSAHVVTSFGGITMEGVTGSVEATNANGSITVNSAARGGCQPIVLRSSFGPIKLRLPDGVNYDVTATTTFGSINLDFPVTTSGAISHDALHGRIGNGGCELRITDSNGRIDILKRH
jgi:hypothetical protein